MADEQRPEQALAITHPFSEDIVLKVLAGLAQSHPGFSIGVTLNVAGGVVSGELIGMSTWFEEIQKNHPELESTAGGFARAFNENLEDTDDVDYVYVHLRNAAIYVANGPLGRGGLFWRGRISEVAGWSFGLFKPDGWS